MFRKRWSEETRNVVVIVAVILLVPPAFYLFDLLAGGAQKSSPEKKEMRVIVSDADKKEVLAKLPPKSVVDNIREAIRQDNQSTAYLQLNKMSKDSPEYEELRKMLAEAGSKRQHPGVRQEAGTPQNPVRYFDESTPRDRSTDALFLYIVDVSGAVWPRFCIQSVGSRPFGITGFRVKADEKVFDIRPATIKSEKFINKVCEYYDAPVDQQSHAAVQALVKSRKASLVATGAGGERVRIITEEEKKGLNRILETYSALGGQFAFINPVNESHRNGPKGKRPVKE